MKMDLKELRGKTDQELLTENKNLREELFRLRFRKVTDIVENPSLVRELRKNIARIETILKERQIELQQKGETSDAKKEDQKAKAQG